MYNVSVSVLAADFANLGRDLQTVAESGCKWLHVDIMDGDFVPNLSMGIPVTEAIRRNTDLTMDVHLMIQKPIRYVENFIKAGADWLTIHVEADTPENTLEALRRIRALGCKAGISVKPGTPASALEPYLTECDLILVMTVEPGFGGQSFRADMMPKLAQLRQRLNEVNPACRLSVDGGVNTVTGMTCRENGADVLVSGSSFFKAADKAAFVRVLEC